MKIYWRQLFPSPTGLTAVKSVDKYLYLRSHNHFTITFYKLQYYASEDLRLTTSQETNGKAVARGIGPHCLWVIFFYFQVIVALK